MEASVIRRPVLTWTKDLGLVHTVLTLALETKSSRVTLLVMIQDADDLPMAKAVAINHMGIRLDHALTRQSMGVLTEGYDLSCNDLVKYS